MYRDFVYMDTGRIQSIIAQLEKGVLDEIMEGKTGKIEGSAGAAAGVLSSFLPLKIEGTLSQNYDTRSSKVLHDYAFNLALEALHKNNLCKEVRNWDRQDIPIADNGFVLVLGDMTILDYGLLKEIAENEAVFANLFDQSQTFGSQGARTSKSKGHNKPGKKQKQSVFQEIGVFVNAIMGDSIQVVLNHSDEITFVGPLSREFLREDTRDLIFKYGGSLQKGWSMLAQISQITKPINKIQELAKVGDKLKEITSGTALSTATDLLNPVVDALNAFQGAMASVSYPNIAVTPIALYRELTNIKR